MDANYQVTETLTVQISAIAMYSWPHEMQCDSPSQWHMLSVQPLSLYVKLLATALHIVVPGTTLTSPFWPPEATSLPSGLNWTLTTPHLCSLYVLMQVFRLTSQTLILVSREPDAKKSPNG